MTAYLLEVNVLIALAWSSHIHHGAAREWFARRAAKRWATCAITQCAFVRISSNPAVIVDAVSPHAARSMLGAMAAHRGHVFWHESLALSDTILDDFLIPGHRQVTDRYLLALAIKKQGTLATFDRSLSALISDARAAMHVECIADFDLNEGAVQPA